MSGEQLEGGLHLDVLALDLQQDIHIALGNAQRLHAVAKAVQAHVQVLLRRQTLAKVTESAIALPIQGVYEMVYRFIVVEFHAGEVRHEAVAEHDGHVRRIGQLIDRLVVRAADEDDAVHAALDQGGHAVLQHVHVELAVGREHRVALLLGAVQDAGNALGIVFGGDVLNDDADNLGIGGAQRPRVLVAMVVERLHRLRHALGGLLGDRRGAVDHMGNGARRYPRQTRHIIDGAPLFARLIFCTGSSRHLKPSPTGYVAPDSFIGSETRQPLPS